MMQKSIFLSVGERKSLKITVLSLVSVPFSCPAPMMLGARHVSHVTRIFF